MITRHFYPREGVGEALLHSLGFTKDPLRKQKAAFWTYELLLSKEEEYLWEILRKAVDKYGSSEDDSLYKSRQLLPLLTSLLSIQWPQPYGPPSPLSCRIPEGLPDQPTHWTDEQRARLWWATQDAIRHKRPERLLRLLGSLHPSVASQYLQTPKGGWRRMLEAVGCPWNLRPGTPVHFPKLPVGHLAARLFALPKSCLSKQALHPAGWDVWNGCSFWKQALQEAGALDVGRFHSVEQEETFYSTYFPDDIPDEWSGAERSKSHITCS
jgi:hypothetical protein